MEEEEEEEGWVGECDRGGGVWDARNIHVLHGSFCLFFCRCHTRAHVMIVQNVFASKMSAGHGDTGSLSTPSQVLGLVSDKSSLRFSLSLSLSL